MKYLIVSDIHGSINALDAVLQHFERERCFRAFLHNNWVGAAVYLALVLTYLP